MAIYNVKGNLRSECIFMEVFGYVLIAPCIVGFFSGWIISGLLGYKLGAGVDNIAARIVISTMIISIIFSTLLFRKSILISIKSLFNMSSKNNFIIDQDNDLFYLPFGDEPFCKLSDIHDVISSVETIRYTEKENGRDVKKEKYRYKLQLIGEFGQTIIKFGVGLSQHEAMQGLGMDLADIFCCIKDYEDECNHLESVLQRAIN